MPDFTLQELWQLFPVRLVPHRPGWDNLFRKNKSEQEKALPEGMLFRISHIESRAVPDILAKEPVDLLLETDNALPLTEITKTAEQAGFVVMSRLSDRISLCCGYTPESLAPEVYHLLIRRFGDCDELYFRDYLRTHPEIAEEYEALKLSLWKPFEHDRDGYTTAMAAFVKRRTEGAKAQYAAEPMPGTEPWRIG